jgi:hypothetical protein
MWHTQTGFEVSDAGFFLNQPTDMADAPPIEVTR